MAFQFPPSPVVDQTFTPVAGVTYRWSGTAWHLLAGPGAFITQAEGDARYRLLTNMTFTGSTLHADGTAGAPGISWANDPDSGWYRDAPSGTASYVQNTVPVLSIATAFIASGPPHRFTDGTLAAPGIGWANETTSGFLRSASGSFKAAVNGVEAFGWDGNGFSVSSGGALVARVDSNKTLKASSIGSYVFGGNIHEFTTGNATHVLGVANSGGTPSGIDIFYPNVSVRGNGNHFWIARDSTGAVAAIKSNGGLANFSTNNENICDASAKENIGDSPDYTPFVSQLQWKHFNIAGQKDDNATDDVLAQDVEQLAPELVGTWFDTGLKSIYSHRLQQRINSVIPRLIERIDALESRLAVLENK